MKIIAIIPARYGSTRFPGKPLVDILGKPMIWWVYNRVKMNFNLHDVYVATDDERILNVCNNFGMKCIMTSKSHETHLDRLAEVATKIDFDFCININGDEPLIEPSAIDCMFPPLGTNPNAFYAANAMTIIENPVEVVDFARIKVVTDVNGYALYLGRSPLPYPKADSNYIFKKFVGIQCFSKSALAFCANTKRGELEKIEDIDEFRFIENGQKIKFVMTDIKSMSVDTHKDVDFVTEILKKTII